MKFYIDNREIEDYQLSNKQLLELVKGSNITDEERQFLTQKIIKKFEYDLCPKNGENDDDVFVRFFSNFVNGKLTSSKDVANKMAQDHRYLQEEMFKVCMKYDAYRDNATADSQNTIISFAPQFRLHKNLMFQLEYRYNDNKLTGQKFNEFWLQYYVRF